MPELVGLSLLVGLLALVATAAVARGLLWAKEDKASQPLCKYTGPGGGDSVSTFLPATAWSEGPGDFMDLSFSSCEMNFPVKISGCTHTHPPQGQDSFGTWVLSC